MGKSKEGRGSMTRRCRVASGCHFRRGRDITLAMKAPGLDMAALSRKPSSAHAYNASRATKKKMDWNEPAHKLPLKKCVPYCFPAMYAAPRFRRPPCALQSSRRPVCFSCRPFRFIIPAARANRQRAAGGPPSHKAVSQKVDLLCQPPSSPDIFCRSWAWVGDSDRLGSRFWSFRGVRSGFDALVHDSNRRSHQALRSQLGSVASPR